MLESQLLMFVPLYAQPSPLQKWRQLPTWGLQLLPCQLPRRQAILLVSFAIFPTFHDMLQPAYNPICSYVAWPEER